MDISLKGKRAIVGGASKGIGRAIAHELAVLGAEITALSRSEDTLKGLVDELDSTQGQAHQYIVCDFLKPDELGEKVSAILSESAPIHILINNTGGPKGSPVLDASLNDFANAFTMHLLSYQKLTSLLVPGMKSADYGRIINILSTSVKQPIDNLGVSNTIRAAVANWSKSLANELGIHGITVNNILPGYTKTERLEELIDMKANMAGVSPEEMLRRMSKDVPMQRIAEPEEIAYSAAFLASPSAAYVTGTNLSVDGGKTKSH